MTHPDAESKCHAHEVGDEPGNYGKGNLGLGFLGPVTNPDARKKKLSAELANGRLAMMAIIGMQLGEVRLLAAAGCGLCVRPLWIVCQCCVHVCRLDVCVAQVLPRRPYRFRLGRLGAVHRLSSAYLGLVGLMHPCRFCMRLAQDRMTGRLKG